MSRFFIVNAQVKTNCINAINQISHDGKMVVEIRERTRTLEQNSKLWALLNDISEQVVWHGMKLSSEDWKNIFTATLKGQKSVPNLSATGFIVLGKSTSRMSVSEMRDMIELIYAFGAEQGVNWGEYEYEF